MSAPDTDTPGVGRRAADGNRLVVIAGVRTPFARMGTDLAALGAEELGRMAVSALLARTGIDPAILDEVILGCVSQPFDAANVARVVALRSGIPDSVPAATVHRNCASGFEAITQAQERMLSGRGEVFVVGGTESMSGVPLLFHPKAAAKFARLGRAKSLPAKLAAIAKFRPVDFKPRIGLLVGLKDPVSALNMGQTAELVAREAGVSREEQDRFAERSHQRALAARERLAAEIEPAYVPPDYKKVLVEDNGPREDSTFERLGRLRPVFEKGTGMVTAGNASQVTDGAVALLVATERRAAEIGIAPLGVLTGYAYAGVDPARMGLGPVHAIARAEETTGLSVSDADLIEINEAFAGQVLACLERMRSTEYARTALGRDRAVGDVDEELLNVNGGAIALGHPVGATGSRLVLTSLLELHRRSAKRALVSLCVGGGQGGALWLERP